MEVEEWVEDARAACAEGERLLSLGNDMWTRDLTDAEKSILIAAANGGELSLDAQQGMLYPVILADGVPASPRQNSYASAMFWEAFRSLCVRGAVNTGAGNRFHLAEPALAMARRLRAERLDTEFIG